MQCLVAALCCAEPAKPTAPVQQSPLAQRPNGRQAGQNNQLLATGIRGIDRYAKNVAANHALLITVSNYPRSPLPGVLRDRELAKELTQKFGIPPENVVQLTDESVTREGLRQAFARLKQQIQPGDRLFVYYSGHGARLLDPATGECIESIVTQDLHAVTNTEIAQWIKPLSRKTDKTIVMLDSCHSGGVAQASARDISLQQLKPKFDAEASSPDCSKATNVRSFSQNRGSDLATTDNNIVLLAAARSDEVAWDTPNGGAMTYNIEQCLNDSAADADNSGSVSMQELATCVQARLDKSQTESYRQHSTLAGNGSLVPWFNVPGSNESSNDQSNNTVDTVAALNDIFNQRDDRWEVITELDKSGLRIGETLRFSVRSQRSGYVYIFYRGSDPNSFYLLFPNQLDADNAITAGQAFELPRSSWNVTALGPAGVDHLLVLVTETPRDFSSFALPDEYVSAAGPFKQIQPSPQSVARVGQLAVLSASSKDAACQSGARRDLGIAKRCSNVFGASLVSVEEKP